MATKDFERLCGLTAKEIDRDKVTNPVLSGILDRITYVGKDGGFMFLVVKTILITVKEIDFLIILNMLIIKLMLITIVVIPTIVIIVIIIN